MFVEYLLLVGAIGLVSVAVAVKYDGQLRDQFQKEISATANKGGSRSNGSMGKTGGGGSIPKGDFAPAPPAGPPTHAQNEADTAQAIADMQAGKKLTPEQRQRLEEVGKTANKGLITLSAGVAASVTRADGRTAKAFAEANSDKGGAAGARLGQEHKPAGSRFKVEGFGEKSTDGGRGTVSAEANVLQRGPAKLGVGVEGDTNGAASAFAKAKVEARTPIPGGGEAKVEAYLKAGLNRLTPAERVALEARMASRASQMREARETRERLLATNLERVGRGEQPLSRLPPD